MNNILHRQTCNFFTELEKNRRCCIRLYFTPGYIHGLLLKPIFTQCSIHVVGLFFILFIYLKNNLIFVSVNYASFERKSLAKY